MIMNYMNRSMIGSGANDYCVENIFSVNEDNLHSAEDNETFSNLHNHWLLWHGTKDQNMMGILFKGL